jgi:hypothetical protein
MFTVKEFLEKVNAGKITEALVMLKESDQKNCSPEVINAIKAIDPKTNDTLLHQLAQSAPLNEALEENAAMRRNHAQSLLRLVMQHSTTSTQKRSNKRTALVEATYRDHRAIINEIYQKECLGIEDSERNTALHYAINHANHVLIDKILKDDKKSYYSLYFKCNKAGLFSLALAMKRYQENPTMLSLSLINQLYFGLPKESLYRTKAVETEINVEWSWFSKPLWQNALRMCGKRDEKGQVKSIDLNLWDLICQVVTDGLTVWSYQVTLPLIYEYSESKSGTPGEMLREANAKCGLGLPGRTLAQTATNASLAKNKEFMQRQNLGQAKYHLVHTNSDPAESKDLDKLFTNDKDWIILFGDKLFYLPQHLATKTAICKEIERDGRREKDQASYDSLKTSIFAMKIGTSRDAESAEIQKIMPLVPLLLDQKSDEVPLVSIREKDHHVMGMTFYAGLNSGVDATTSSPSTTSAAEPDSVPIEKRI